MKVRIHWSVLFLLSYIGIGYGSSPVLLLTRFLAIVVVILLHEFGHYWAAIWRGYRVYEIVVHWSGGYCSHEPARNSRDRLIISSGGIAVQLLLFLSASLIWTILVRTMDRIPGLFVVLLHREFIRYNIINIGFNLMPIPPLDGYSIFESFLPAMKEFRLHGLESGFTRHQGARVFQFSGKTAWWKRKAVKKSVCPFCGSLVVPGRHKCSFSQVDAPSARPAVRTGKLVKRVGVVVVSVVLIILFVRDLAGWFS